jgi:hypothetical protein
MKARDVMNKRVTAATPRAIGRDLALQLLSGMFGQDMTLPRDFGF